MPGKSFTSFHDGNAAKQSHGCIGQWHPVFISGFHPSSRYRPDAGAEKLTSDQVAPLTSPERAAVRSGIPMRVLPNLLALSSRA